MSVLSDRPLRPLSLSRFSDTFDLSDLLGRGAAPEPAAPDPDAPVDDGTPDDDREAVSPVRDEQGAPIPLRQYCELVTPAWNWNWPHLLYVSERLDAVTRREINRLEINLPTRVGKTELLVRYVAERLELDPTLHVIIGAYNATFARRLSRKIRKLVAGRVVLSPDRQAADDWETAAGGGVLALGVGVGSAGLPADLIVIDDPIKNREDAYSKAFRNKVDEWYREDVYTRLEPTGQVILCNARRHEDDLSGRIQASEEAPDWTVVRLPALAEVDDPLGRKEGEAICPDRFTEAYYAKQRRAIGEAAFSAMQQQRPAPASGLIFNAAWIRYYTTREHPIIEDGLAVPYLPERFTHWAQSWDMSFKDKATSDFVAGLVGARKGADCYVMPEHVHDRLNFPKTIDAVRKLSLLHPRAHLKLVEDKANGPAVISSLKSEVAGLVGVEPEGDKVSRAWAVTPIMESGNVWFPHPAIAPWVKGFVLELLQFPLGAHDDLVDALTQLLRRFMQQIELEDRERRRTSTGSTSMRTYGA